MKSVGTPYTCDVICPRCRSGHAHPSAARAQQPSHAAPAGQRGGPEFSDDRVMALPNHALAHRPMSFAAGAGEAQKVEAIGQAMFQACLPEGRSIGDAESLAEPASPIGFGSDEVRRHRPRPVGQHDVVAAEQPDPINPVRSAPAVRIGHTVLIGAQPAALLAQALHTAAALPTSPH